MPDNKQVTTTTSDILDEQIHEKRRAKTAEIPVELKEFAKNYDVQGLIGEGGMSAVFRANHRALNKPMAIKMLHAHLLRDVVQLKRFEQEAQALFMLQHENIVTIREFGSTSTGKPYLVMDFLEGKSLAEVIKNEGPIPVRRALRMFLQVCNALEHAHSKGIVHRDIKPSNIVICPDEANEDSVRIVDFGIAKFACDDINPGLTQTGDVFGSPLYMSPEQCLGQKLDGRSDTYAFGCVMYESLSGKPPLVGETALSTIHKHTTEAPLPLTVPNCDAKLRRRLDEIVFKTLEKDPDKRYQSMGALRADLQELMADTGYRGTTNYYVRYARFYRRLINTIRRNPFRYIGGFAAIAAICVMSGITLMDHSASMLQPPKPLNTQLDWNWMAMPVEEAPVNFTDKLRQAWVIIEDARGRLGPGDEVVKRRERRMAMELLKYGQWDKAIQYLALLRKGYSPSDPMVADLDQLIGNVYVQKKQWPDALSFYNNAMTQYRNTLSADNSETIARMKYGWCLLRNDQVGKAKSHFERVAKQNGDPTKFECDFAAAGIADCDMAQLESGVKDEVSRSHLFGEAQSNYTLASAHLGQFSKHDAALCKVRIADLFILRSQWKEACDLYTEVMKDTSLFSNTEVAKLQRNYARLLMRNLNLSLAFQTDDEAKETERRAAREQNEQNTLRFDAEEQH